MLKYAPISLLSFVMQLLFIDCLITVKKVSWESKTNGQELLHYRITREQVDVDNSFKYSVTDQNLRADQSQWKHMFPTPLGVSANLVPSAERAVIVCAVLFYKKSLHSWAMKETKCVDSA